MKSPAPGLSKELLNGPQRCEDLSGDAAGRHNAAAGKTTEMGTEALHRSVAQKASSP